MKVRTRLLAALACGLVALDCFQKHGGELELPYWLWAVVGVTWVLNALNVMVPDPQ